MPKYQLRNDHTEEWEEGGPIPELAALLDVLPYSVVTLSGNIDWRLKPRDTKLVGAIYNAIRGHTFDADRANAVYDLLEERGLV